MAWYVGKDGQQRWIQRDESVYTVIQPGDSLPLENLSYLTTSTKKAVFQEHLMEEDPSDAKKRSKRERNRMAGKQRGFVVRVEQEEQLRVVPWFKAASTKLLDCKAVSKIDAEDAVNMKKKKKENKNDKTTSLLGVNECRVETTARIHHFAHGPGFRVEVSEGSVQQRIHFFTYKKELVPKDWHKLLVAALESTGAHVMLARRTASAAEQAAKDGEADDDIEQISSLRMDAAQKDDDAWFASVMRGIEANSEDGEDDEDDSSESEDDAKQVPVNGGAPAPKDPQIVAQAKAKMQTNASENGEIPEWRRRNPPMPTNPLEKNNPLVRRQPQAKQQPSRLQGSTRPPQQQQQQQSSEPSRPRGWWQVREEPQPQQNPSRQPPSRQVPQHQPQPRQAPQWQQAESSRQPPPRQAPQQQSISRQVLARQPEEHRWQGQEQWWQQDSWQETARPPPQSAEKAACAAPVRDFFDKFKAQEERSGASMGKELREMLAKCAECGRGKPLKLFQDLDDEQWYCRKCWVDFYGLEPPGKPGRS